MGPILTTSRTGALPGGSAQLMMLEGVMGYCPHISVKGDMSLSSVTADLFAWMQKMGKNGKVVEQQIMNIDDISRELASQLSFNEKRKNSVKSTLELMAWVRERYIAALGELKKKVSSADAKAKKEFEDAMLTIQESEVKIGELIADIKRKLNLPPGSLVKENSLRQVRQKAAQLSEAVADVEKMSSRVQDNLQVENAPKQDVQMMLLENLRNCVSQIQKDSPNAEPRQWIVVGGGNNQGIFVQYGSEAMSEQMPDRLSTGARVEEVALSQDGMKLLFKKIQGEGPEC